MSLARPPPRRLTRTEREAPGVHRRLFAGALLTNSMVPLSVSIVPTILSPFTVRSHLSNAAVRPGWGDVLIVSLPPLMAPVMGIGSFSLGPTQPVTAWVRFHLILNGASMGKQWRWPALGPRTSTKSLDRPGIG